MGTITSTISLNSSVRLDTEESNIRRESGKEKKVNQNESLFASAHFRESTAQHLEGRGSSNLRPQKSLKTPVFEMICFRGTGALVPSTTFQRECISYIDQLADEMGRSEAEFRQRILVNLMQPI